MSNRVRAIPSILPIKQVTISFELAATVFRDPRALSIYDEEHSIDEERWLTLGISATGGLLVVHHTFTEEDDETVIIRIISSRKTTKQEQQQYTE
ncbi:MAG: BrnT family toxin [Gemmatimonadetes bacterium]|nr:BrnT family toxin [Gemmatimonadota bacterium]